MTRSGSPLINEYVQVLHVKNYFSRVIIFIDLPCPLFDLQGQTAKCYFL